MTEDRNLPLYELGTHEPRAWLSPGGRIDHPEGPHPEIMFAAVPIMLHLSNGYSIAPIDDEWTASEDGHWTGPLDRCPTCSGRMTREEEARRRPSSYLRVREGHA